MGHIASFIIGNIGFLLLALCLIFIAEGLVSIVAPRKVIYLGRQIYRKLRLRRTTKADSDIPARAAWLQSSYGVLYLVLGVAWLVIMRPSVTVLPTDAPSSTASAFGVSPSGDKPDKAEVRAEIERAVKAAIGDDHVGIVVGVLTEDGAQTFGYGRMRIDSNTPPDGDTLFELGSVTKVFTATALSALVLNKEVALEDPLRNLLPSGLGIPPGAGTEITLLDLVTHTSGLPRIPFSLLRPRDFFLLGIMYQPYENITEKKVYGYLRRRGLENSPAQAFSYSNFGAGLLGFALARHKGCTYEELITSTVCEPLGMKDTAVTLSPEQQARMADGYCGELTLGRLCFYLPCGRWTFSECTQGAGALCSSANDMLRFLAANAGLAESELTPVLEQGHVPRRDIGGGYKIGLGWLACNKSGIDGPVLWHNGGTGGYRSFVAFSKANRFGVVVLTNSTRLVDDVGWSVLKALAQSKGGDAAASN